MNWYRNIGKYSFILLCCSSCAMLLLFQRCKNLVENIYCKLLTYVAFVGLSGHVALSPLLSPVCSVASVALSPLLFCCSVMFMLFYHSVACSSSSLHLSVMLFMSVICCSVGLLHALSPLLTLLLYSSVNPSLHQLFLTLSYEHQWSNDLPSRNFNALSRISRSTIG